MITSDEQKKLLRALARGEVDRRKIGLTMGRHVVQEFDFSVYRDELPNLLADDEDAHRLAMPSPALGSPSRSVWLHGPSLEL